LPVGGEHLQECSNPSASSPPNSADVPEEACGSRRLPSPARSEAGEADPRGAGPRGQARAVIRGEPKGGCMIRKTGKRTKGAIGAMPTDRADPPGERTTPRPLRNRPTPPQTKPRQPQAHAPAVTPPGATGAAIGLPAIAPALYERLRRCADETRSTVESAMGVAIEGFLQSRGY
jgi:hypothetical protein